MVRTLDLTREYEPLVQRINDELDALPRERSSLAARKAGLAVLRHRGFEGPDRGGWYTAAAASGAG